jgi:glycine hydroxymethyltransferase
MKKNYPSYIRHCFASLETSDPVMFELICKEHERQNVSLVMVASSGVAYPSVIAATATDITNLTLEGYIGNRFHAGCAVIDEIEQLAIERAKKLFNAQYANVQPLTAAVANNGLLFSLLNANDTILSMCLDAGGHLTHGAKVAISGKYFNVVSYGVNNHGWIDYDEVRDLAQKHKPRLIICGASAYPREIDYRIFRQIADEFGSLLLADISHIAGLIVAGILPNPIDHAHLGGPRGGLVVIGKDADTTFGGKRLSLLVQNAIFPGIQGAPNLASVTAKSVAFGEILKDNQFRIMMKHVVTYAKLVSEELSKLNYDVITGGTDTHMVVLNILSSRAMTGLVSEKSLEKCNIIVNKNRIFGDTKSAFVTSGVRLGTNTLAYKGISRDGVIESVRLIHEVLSSVQVVDDKNFYIDPKKVEEIKQRINTILLMKTVPEPIELEVARGVS